MNLHQESPELLPPAAADRATVVRLIKTHEKPKSSITNRPARPTYPREKSVLTSEASPQINYEAWLRPMAYPLERALNPCTNITLGTTILSADYTQALSRSATMNEALLHSLSLYNSGSEWRSLSYAQVVLTGRVSSSASLPAHRSGSAERARDAAVTFPGLP